MKTVSIPESKEESSPQFERTVFQPARFGFECAFLQMTPTVGIKIFPTRFNANYSITRQRQAYEKQIAPKVLSEIQMCFINHEIFKQDTNNLFKRFTTKGTCGYFYKTQVAQTKIEFGKEYFDAICNLKNILKRLGMGSKDLHKNNIGRIGKRWVVIDFGLLSRS